MAWTDRRIIHGRPLFISADGSAVKRLFPGTAAHDPPHPCRYSFPRWRRSAAFAVKVASPPWGSHFCWPQWISFLKFKKSCNSLTLSYSQDFPRVTQSVGAQKGAGGAQLLWFLREFFILRNVTFLGRCQKSVLKKAFRNRVILLLNQHNRWISDILQFHTVLMIGCYPCVRLIKHKYHYVHRVFF